MRARGALKDKCSLAFTSKIQIVHIPFHPRPRWSTAQAILSQFWRPSDGTPPLQNSVVAPRDVREVLQVFASQEKTTVLLLRRAALLMAHAMEWDRRKRQMTVINWDKKDADGQT